MKVLGSTSLEVFAIGVEKDDKQTIVIVGQTKPDKDGNITLFVIKKDNWITNEEVFDAIQNRKKE